VKDYVTPAPFVRYDADGAIVEAGLQGVAFITDRIAAGERVLLALTPHVAVMQGDPVHHVDPATRRLRERTACPAALDGLTLTGLPVPCRIEITAPGGAPALYPWDEAALTLSFEHPGRYTVRVLSVPHRPGVFEVSHDG
jgi:hypothetical protein